MTKVHLVLLVFALGVSLVKGDCLNVITGKQYKSEAASNSKTSLKEICGKYLDLDKMSSTCCTSKVLNEYTKFLNDYFLCRACKASIISMMCNYCKEQQTNNQVTMSAQILEIVQSACVFNNIKKGKPLLKGLCNKDNHTICTVPELLDALNSKWKIKLMAGQGQQSFNPPVYGCFETNPEGKCCACSDCPEPCKIESAFRPRTTKNNKQYTTSK